MLLGACAAQPTAQSQLVRDTSKYAKLSKDAEAMIEPGETAFMLKDAKGAAASITDDFSWWLVGKDGPKQVVKGKEATEKLMAQFFGQSNFESKVYRLGMVGNILVQVEVDKVQTPEGPKETVSLELYEFKNGKRWREWRFTPEGDGR
jgi:hypothetical protein